MTSGQAEERNWEHLPLRYAYPFAEERGLLAESSDIRGNPDVTPNLRRGLFIELFRHHKILDEFIKECWPNVDTAKGRKRILSYLRKIERYRKGIDEPDGEVGEDATPEADAEFALEQELENFIYRNWNHIDFGMPLRLYKDESGRDGRQWDTGEIGRIDFLCENTSDGSLLVIELKKGKPSDKVVGQIQRYMGWVEEKLATGRPVRGMIISPALRDPSLRYALRVADTIEWKQYEVTFSLRTPSDDAR